jgi:hypothetical protein
VAEAGEAFDRFTQRIVEARGDSGVAELTGDALAPFIGMKRVAHRVDEDRVDEQTPSCGSLSNVTGIGWARCRNELEMILHETTNQSR